MAISTLKLALLLLVAPLSGCDYEVEEGSYEGLVIGSTKEQMVDILVSRGVRDVLPIVDRSRLASFGDVRALDDMKDEAGLCIDSSSGMAKIRFDERGIATFLKAVPSSSPLSAELTVGMSRQDFMAMAGRYLRSDSHSRVFTCIPDDGWVRIADGGDNEIGQLLRFDSWSFHEPNAYSHADLRFADGKLARIDYHWRPFEE